MKKTLLVFLLGFISLLSALTFAVDSNPVQVVDPVPTAEAVPAPAIEPDDIPATKTSKGTKDAVLETKIGLISTVKSCKTIKGKLICKTKKVKGKSRDSGKKIKKSEKEDNTP